MFMVGKGEGREMDSSSGRIREREKGFEGA